jgi:hypothetical protein
MRRQADVAMQQADHDLLIRISTQLEALTNTTRDHHASTTAALATKAERAELAELRTRLEEAARKDDFQALVTACEKQKQRTDKLEKITWIAFGGIIAIEVIFKYAIPAMTLARIAVQNAPQP